MLHLMHKESGVFWVVISPIPSYQDCKSNSSFIWWLYKVSSYCALTFHEIYMVSVMPLLHGPCSSYKLESKIRRAFKSQVGEHAIFPTASTWHNLLIDHLLPLHSAFAFFAQFKFCCKVFFWPSQPPPYWWYLLGCFAGKMFGLIRMWPR